MDVPSAAMAASAPIAELFDGVDDLIKRVADVENPEIRKMRAKVHATMVVAKSAFERCESENRAHPMRGRVTAMADSSVIDGSRGSIGGSEDDQPVDGLGMALLVGLGLGLVLSVRP
jgi:ElaB/YqjD/DUF883 family membrane-anchored ribosome-binding protein